MIKSADKSVLRYLNAFVASPQVLCKIAAEFNFDRLLTLGINMGFRTFVSSRPIRNVFENEAGFKVPTRSSLDISDYCNLHCKKCYVERKNRLMAEDIFEKIVTEGEEIGIHALPIFGGEPFHPKTRDILFSSVQRHPNVEYLICTNGSYLKENEVIEGITQYKNIFPYLSLDGLKTNNDRNRGAGVFDCVSEAMDILKERRIFYGVSTVLTRENMDEVSGEDFFRFLDSKNARVIYIRKCFVPGNCETFKTDVEQEARFCVNLSIVARRYGIHTLGGEMRNPARRDIGLREHHLLHFMTDGVARYGRFGPECGNIRTQHLLEILKSDRMKESVRQNFINLYGLYN
jgi:sulfatase maturation enzyme AslB (radical SAM superfamily)